ncbi:MAG TPA: tyrosine-type recombinase/integrase [Gaiellaceae bacterium]|jgi:site-specific recombinase XerD|nr:tyrosine-type recombinase/integrase [Gaiellaceae bacterium]
MAKRKPQRLPRSLTPDERRKLMAAPEPRWKTPRRDRAMIATMLYAGLRAGEVVTIKPRDVDLEQFLIRVHGKGDKERVVPIEPALEPYLRAWRAERWAGPGFFTTRTGKLVATSQLRETVKRYGVRAGIEDLHPHILRHTAANYWLTDRRLDIEKVRFLMGHASLATTQRYLHANPADLAREMRGWK